MKKINKTPPSIVPSANHKDLLLPWPSQYTCDVFMHYSIGAVVFVRYLISVAIFVLYAVDVACFMQLVIQEALTVPYPPFLQMSINFDQNGLCFKQLSNYIKF